MSSMGQAYEAYLFDNTEETGRKKIDIFVKREGLVFTLDESKKIIPWAKMSITYGGSNNSVLFLKSTKEDEPFQLFTSDKNITKAIKKEVLYQNPKILASLNKGWFWRFAFSAKGFLVSLIILASILYFLASWTLPKLKRTIADAIPPDVEVMIGDKIFEEQIKEYKVISSPMTKEVLNKIHQRFQPTLQNQPFEFKYTIVDKNIVNAFALPGGYIVITSDLILQTETAEELAGIISHEISHITERHMVQRILSNLGVIVVAQVLLGDVSGLATIMIQGAQLFTMMQFSQSQETEADEKGFALLKEAKISPKGIVAFFSRMNKNKPEELQKVEGALSAFSSHPLDLKRVSNLESLMREHPYEPVSLEIDWDKFKEEIKEITKK